jgi:hypothetical protein
MTSPLSSGNVGAAHELHVAEDGRGKIIEIPPPELRLCKIHGRPITPSNWARRNRHRGCSRCDNERNQVNGSRQRHWQRKSYKSVLEKRHKYYSNGLRGIELFNRSIGYELVDLKTGTVKL